MWPFKKNTHEQKWRAEDEFARDIEQSLSAAAEIADKGERLLELERIRQSVDHRMWWLQTQQHETARRKYQKPMETITSAGFIAGVAVPFVVPGAALMWLAYFATVGSCTGAGVGLGLQAKKKYLARNEMQNRPILLRLARLSVRADEAIEDTLNTHLHDVGKSPHFVEVLERLPQAREAFAKVAAALPEKEMKQAPPKPPGKGLNL